jgi:mevalonate pyrophosphate decarboxylase
MKKESTAVAYPTIPIIFLGGINDDRSPLYDTMGLAVTSLEGNTRTKTRITLEQETEQIPPSPQEAISFYLEGKVISGKRGKQILQAIYALMVDFDQKTKIIVNSSNHNIYSGSSDAGLSALFWALNDFFGLDLSSEELLKYAMKGSESVGRSLYGGLTQTIASTSPVTVKQLASAEELSKINLFAVPFDYPSRVSADEIHAAIVTNPQFDKRIEQIPIWVKEIKQALKKKDLIELLEIAEENIRNAHELLEGVNTRVRKPEMMQLCKEIHALRDQDIPAYFLIGGGNLITVATLEDYSSAVVSHLENNGWAFTNYKVASGPKVIQNR